jgi:hypothetical protein
MLTRTLKPAAIAAAAIAAVVVLPAAASAAAASPDTCKRAVTGAPGSITYTITVTADSCGQQIRASAYCLYPGIGSHWAHGNTVTAAGKTSKLDCGLFVEYFDPYGYAWYNGTKWVFVTRGSTF